MIKTRLTEAFGLDHPVISAPMAFAAGGALAASVSRAGGLGLIGGAYGDPDWIEQQFQAAGNTEVGCGVITWAVAERPEIVGGILQHKPRALFLSFADPKSFIDMADAADVPVICQVQTLKDAKHAIECGARVIVAQGSEAGGHGESRGTFTLVPEIADFIAAKSPDTLLCAAGGIADGRGLAASLMLGADGVLIGSRFWASEEALVHPNMLEAAFNSTGDDTVRSSVMDIARRLNWPDRYTGCDDATDKVSTKRQSASPRTELSGRRFRCLRLGRRGKAKSARTAVRARRNPVSGFSDQQCRRFRKTGGGIDDTGLGRVSRSNFTTRSRGKQNRNLDQVRQGQDDLFPQ